MKITNLKTYPVTQPHIGIDHIVWIFVRLDTNEGLSGWGEAGGISEVKKIATMAESYEIKNGHLVLNGKPGLGYDLNEDWLAAHAKVA